MTLRITATPRSLIALNVAASVHSFTGPTFALSEGKSISGMHCPPNRIVSSTRAESEDSTLLHERCKCSACEELVTIDRLSSANLSGSASSSVPPESVANTDAMVPSFFPTFFAPGGSGGVVVVEDDVEVSSEGLNVVDETANDRRVMETFGARTALRRTVRNMMDDGIPSERLETLQVDGRDR